MKLKSLLTQYARSSDIRVNHNAITMFDSTGRLTPKNGKIIIWDTTATV